MVHMFASEVLIYEQHFLSVLPLPPQIPLEELTLKDITISVEEYEVITTDIVKMVVDLMVMYMPQRSCFKKCVPDTIADLGLADKLYKTKAVPLRVLPLNEMYYQDDVKIFEYYEKVIGEVYEEAGIKLTEQTHIQVGGDQLTRERLSVAKLMRLGNAGIEMFQHLQPIVFEFLHLGINFLEKLPYTLCGIRTLMMKKVSPLLSHPSGIRDRHSQWPLCSFLSHSTSKVRRFLPSG
jgi:hypothetical protein